MQPGEDSAIALTELAHAQQIDDARPTSVSANLPFEPTSFVGREAEQAEVGRLLGAARLLTLTGPGGVGKTRLAVQLARRAHENGAYPGGAWFVGLAPVADPALVPHAIAAVLGIRGQTDCPRRQSVIQALRKCCLLLLLDNCEHLVHACAELAEAIVRECPQVTVLATSREALNLPGEIVWQVPPLSIPGRASGASAQSLLGYEAARLFAERAATKLPSFAVTDDNAAAVGKICARLNGIPLAIELAAARVRLLSPDQIAAHLDDHFQLLTTGARTAVPRHRTIRGLVDWSYELLNQDEQTLFGRLSIFAGGWALEAAEAVCAGDDLERGDVMDLLGRLVDKSLVVADGTVAAAARYHLLETLRQYAGERHRATGDSALAWRHARYFLELAERAELDFRAGDERSALARVDREIDNIRAALRFLIDNSAGQEAERLAGALGHFWFFRGYLSEGRAWLSELLAQPAAPAGRAARAEALFADAFLAEGQADFASADHRGRTALELWRELGPVGESRIPYALFVLGRFELLRNGPAAARPFLEEGLRRARTVGDRSSESLNLLFLGEAAASEGDDAEARARAREALDLAAAIGSSRTAAVALRMLGDVLWREGDLDGARSLLEESLARAREVGPWLAAWTTLHLGEVLAAQGNVAGATGPLAEALGTYRDAGDRDGMASALEAIARVVASHPADALRLVATSSALREEAGLPLPLTAADRLSPVLESARAALGVARADAAWAAGRELTADDAFEEALRALHGHSEHLSAGNRQAHVSGGPLTPREREVAVLVARGLGNRAIAAELVVTEATVERHLGNAFAKLGFSSRAQLAVWAVERGLYQPS